MAEEAHGTQTDRQDLGQAGQIDAGTLTKSFLGGTERTAAGWQRSFLLWFSSSGVEIYRERREVAVKAGRTAEWPPPSNAAPENSGEPSHWGRLKGAAG